MGYKKYSPFLKSIKILILISFMYFTTHLDALKVPVTISKLNFDALPVYCGESTRHFKCNLKNGTELCIPEAFKCKIECANNAELNCEHAITQCKPGQYQCKSNDKSLGNKAKAHCIPELSLCDGRVHCPLEDDENPSMCAKRKCGKNEFKCMSPGHCIAKNKVCDGQPDCFRDSLDDKSDEDKCAKPQSAMGVCKFGEVKCKSKCVYGYQCDGHRDCDDGSDELNCAVDECLRDEFSCDNKCLPKSKRCDGVFDCTNGMDEKNCHGLCNYNSDIYCPIAKTCLGGGKLSICDGIADCPNAEDELCSIDNIVCRYQAYYTCRSGDNCIHNSTRCDGIRNCPDGSDEMNCPTKAPPTPSPCKPADHLCKGTTNLCVNLQEACYGKKTCPNQDGELEQKCKLFNDTNFPCSENNNKCQQVCTPVFNADKKFVAQCSCHSGWQVSSDNPQACIDVNECKEYGTCSQLCRNTIGNYTCSCRDGYKLAHDGSCVAHGSSKILYSTNNGIKIIDTVTDKVSSLIDRILLPKYIAYDYSRRQVFFHTRDGILGVVGMNGKGYKTLYKDRRIISIAYDWSRRLLFYAELDRDYQNRGYIGVINTTSRHDSTLRTVSCPHGLAANPEYGMLYVTIWCGSKPGVYAMSMNGKRIKRIIPTIAKPGHLAIDFASSPQRLFWTNGLDNAIESANLTGGDKRQHIANKYKKSEPFDVVVFEDNVYWNDLKGKAFYQINKFNSSKQKVLVSNQPVVSVTIYHSALQPITKIGECRQCSQTCIAGAVGEIPTCLCDKHYSLNSDGSCSPDAGKEIAKPVNSKTDNSQFTSESTDSETELVRSTQTSETAAKMMPKNADVNVIFTVAIGVICGGALIGVAVCFVCMRCQDKQSVTFESFTSSDQSLKTANCPMPKINSRTPLTYYEIDVDNNTSRI